MNQLRLACQRRDIIWYLIVSELKATYRNKVLGYVWTLLDPLVMMGIYILLVTGVFGRGGPQYPIVLFTALLAWWWFAQSVSASVDSISGKSKLIQAVPFPKIVLPLYRVGVSTAKYFFGMFTLIPFLIAYDAEWTINMLWLPLLLLVQLVLTVGICLIVAIIGVYAQDMQNIIKFAIRALFFLSPALYSAYDRIPDDLIGIYMLNPFAALFESYRNILIYGQPPESTYLLIAAGIGVGFLLIGLHFFDMKEDDLATVV